MKTLIIGINSQFVHLNLAIRSLNASANYKMEMLEFNINTEMTQVYGDILSKNADLLLFSAYIWNVEYVMKLARDLKLANPSVKIVFGGPEVSFTAKETVKQNDFIDYILCGECEEILPKFLEKLEKNENPHDLTGVVGKDGVGDDTYNIVEDVSVLKTAKEIYIDTPKNQIYYYETTRGCPYSCSYCLSGSIKDKTRYLDLERVFIDLKYFSEQNIPLVKFVDRTFNANKKRAKAIIEFATKNTGDTSFHFEVGADILDDEMINMLNDAPHGKFQLEAGVQSCNEKTLKEVVRTTNFDKLQQNVKKIIDGNNVHLHLDLIAGLPYDNYESFGNSINQLYKMNAHHLQLGFLKLLKGSNLLTKSKKYGVIYREYPPYEVISTDDISSQEIVKLKHIEEIIERYYNKEVGRNAFEIVCKVYDMPFAFLEEISEDFYEKGYLSAPMSVQKRLDVLAEFAKSKLSDENYIEFLESILFDVCILKGGMPECLQQIVENIDNKTYRKELFEQGKITGEEFKKAKFVVSRGKIIMSYEKKYKIFKTEGIIC